MRNQTTIKMGTQDLLHNTSGNIGNISLDVSDGIVPKSLNMSKVGKSKYISKQDQTNMDKANDDMKRFKLVRSLLNSAEFGSPSGKMDKVDKLWDDP